MIAEYNFALPKTDGWLAILLIKEKPDDRNNFSNAE